MNGSGEGDQVGHFLEALRMPFRKHIHEPEVRAYRKPFGAEKYLSEHLP